MALVKTEKHGEVVILRLNRGVTNPINLDLVRDLRGGLQEVREDPSVRSLVVTSSNNKFFSIGFDIPQLIELTQKDFQLFYRSFDRLSLELCAFPKPTMAGITGHAIAGGCILALCCDHRFIAEGKKLMGLNEAKLGVPVPYPGDCVLRHMVSTPHAREILEAGEFYNPQELLLMGVVDEVLPLEEVLPKALEKARSLGAAPHEAFARKKQSRMQPILEEIERGLRDREELFMERWYSEEVRARLREAIQKF